MAHVAPLFSAVEDLASAPPEMRWTPDVHTTSGRSATRFRLIDHTSAWPALLTRGPGRTSGVCSCKSGWWSSVYAAKEVLADGPSVAEVAHRHGVARQTVHRWSAKCRRRGLAELVGRSNRPELAPVTRGC